MYPNTCHEQALLLSPRDAQRRSCSSRLAGWLILPSANENKRSGEQRDEQRQHKSQCLVPRLAQPKSVSTPTIASTHDEGSGTAAISKTPVSPVIKAGFMSVPDEVYSATVSGKRSGM